LSRAGLLPQESKENHALSSMRVLLHCVTIMALMVMLSQILFAENGSVALKGKVVDGRTGEAVAAADVLVNGTSIKTQTDEHGDFALSDLGNTEFQLQVTCVGYGRWLKTVHPGANTYVTLSISLIPEALSRTDSVTVTAEPFETPDTNAPSEVTLSKQEIQSLSNVLLGDPMRAAQALPGVATNNDFDSSITVRGAGPSHVGVYLDGIETTGFLDSATFNSGGLSGNANISLPVVNADMVSQISLLAGVYPSNYGDSSVAVMSMETRNGDFDKTSGRILLGMLGSSAVVDGPFAHKKASWILAGRTSFGSALSSVIQNVKNGDSDSSSSSSPTPAAAPSANLSLGFNDLQSKGMYRISPTQEVSLSAIYGNFDLNNNYSSASLDNSNNAPDKFTSQHLFVNAAWKYTPDAKLMARANLFGIGGQSKDINYEGGVLDSSGNTSSGLRGDISYQALPDHLLEVGTYIQNVQGHSVSNEFNAQSDTVPVKTLASYGLNRSEESFYLQDTWRNSHVILTGGTRVEHSGLTGQLIGMPQGAITWLTGRKWTFHAGAGLYSQLPTYDEEFGYYGNNNLHAELSASYNLSVERAMGEHARFLVEAYDRQDRNQIFSLNGPRLLNGQVALLSNPYENSLHGYARGGEITLQRRSANRLTGWASYAYGKTWYTDRTDNLGFVGDYDQRHTVNVFASYRIRPTINFSTQYRYGSGMPIPGFYESSANNNFTAVSDRNTSRLPDYSRMDLRANKTFSFQRFRMTASGEVLNVTDHSNYFFLTQDSMRIQTVSQFGSQEKKSMPITPAVSVSFEF